MVRVRTVRTRVAEPFAVWHQDRIVTYDDLGEALALAAAIEAALPFGVAVWSVEVAPHGSAFASDARAPYVPRWAGWTAAEVGTRPPPVDVLLDPGSPGGAMPPT